MTSPNLPFTGERFVPGVPGEIAFEHWHRYAFAARLVAGRRVLDAACGEGYGSALLARSAAQVTGVDVDAATVEHARERYPGRKNLQFDQGSVAALGLKDASVDAIVSFETIEHLAQQDQPRMLTEFARLLAPGGILILSSPNRPQYSEARSYANPFHLHELDRNELERLLDADFPARCWLRQRRLLASSVWAEQGDRGFEIVADGEEALQQVAMPEAMYFIVVAARAPEDLPHDLPRVSLFADVDDREWTRLDAQVGEVMRLDGLLAERDATVDRQTGHIRHLEELVAFRERLVVERDGQLDALRTQTEALRGEFDRSQAELRERLGAHEARGAQLERRVTELESQIATLDAQRVELERALSAQERIIAYRASVWWWLVLPWVRMRGLWERLRAT